MSCSWVCCKGDDTRETRDGSSAKVTGGAGGGDGAVLEDFLMSTLGEAERFITELADPQATKQAIALTFLNSIAELIRNKWRQTFAAAKEKMMASIQKSKLQLFSSCVGLTQEQYMDDGFTRLLAAWRSHNPGGKKKIAAEEISAILAALYIHLDIPANRETFTFYDVMQFHFRWIACNTAALEVFGKFSEGKETMTAEQLARFLRETQRIDVTDRQIMEKLTYRYGGMIHRYNFACYNGSVLTNCAIDPSRTSDVWQDMTQPFTRYVLCCARVDSPSTLEKAVSLESVRAIVLPELRKAGPNNYLCGTCPLNVIITSIKKHGFATNTYPIVLCLPPASSLPRDVQAEVAQQLSEGFGSFLGKGLMLEGSVISDPKFSPGALRKKVLLMGSQSSLKPFVGFMVADMNKDGLGVRVTDVVEGTPAAKGGVSKDDWLTHVNGQAISNKQRLRELLSTVEVGSEIAIKRENMDEMKIIVGGVVNPNDTTVAPELSNLVFFKYADTTGKPKPWDTNILSSSSLLASGVRRQQFEDHFAFVSISGKEADSSKADILGRAMALGIQFVDVDNSERCLGWSRGRFTDNGRCGYLLKASTEGGHQEVARDVEIDVIVGPRAIGNPPVREGTIELFGPGKAKMVGSNVTFTGCTESSICVLRVIFETDNVENAGFIASFCPALCRPGFRALPCLPIKNNVSWKGGGIHGTYVFIKINA